MFREVLAFLHLACNHQKGFHFFGNRSAREIFYNLGDQAFVATQMSCRDCTMNSLTIEAIV